MTTTTTTTLTAADWVAYFLQFADANPDLAPDELSLCMEELLDKAHRRGAMDVDTLDAVYAEIFGI